MSLLKILQQAQGGQGLAQLAQQFGLEDTQADQLTNILAPAIGSAAKQRAQQGGAQALLEALRGQDQGALFDDPRQAASRSGQAQGRAFLEQLMGGRAQTDGLAQEAANRTGIDSSLIMKLLPALAAMAQGGMQQNMPDNSIDNMLSGLTGQQSQRGSGGLGGLIGGLLGGGRRQSQSGLNPLMQMLDQDGDGSPLDDILGSLMK